MKTGSKRVEYWEKYCEEKADYFCRLNIYLAVFQDYLVNGKLSDVPVPIPKESLEELENSKMRAFQKATEVEDQDVIDQIEKEIEEFGQTDPSTIAKLRVDNLKLFYEVDGLCCSMEELYEQIKRRRAYSDIRYMHCIETLGTSVVGKAFELIGYWTAKVEKSKQSKPGVMKKIQDVADNVEKIKKLIKRYPKYETDPVQKMEFLTQAMKETGITTTRTIDHYIKRLHLK